MLVIGEGTDEEDREVDVVTAPLKPRIQGPGVSWSEKTGELLSPITSKLSSLSFPADPRLLLIGATVLVVLLAALIIRGCSGSAPSETDPTTEGLPVDALEQLLIATPEPILFELPDSDS